SSIRRSRGTGASFRPGDRDEFPVAILLQRLLQRLAVGFRAEQVGGLVLCLIGSAGYDIDFGLPVLAEDCQRLAVRLDLFDLGGEVLAQGGGGCCSHTFIILPRSRFASIERREFTCSAVQPSASFT